MKKLFLLLMMSIAINANASFTLLEHENSDLLEGTWNYFPQKNGKIAVAVQIKIQTNGWKIDDEWSMLRFTRSYNGEVIEINPHYLNEDDNQWTYFKVDHTGPNSAYISFCDIWFTDNIDDVKHSITTYTVTGKKNKKDHNCVILVNYNDITTNINELQSYQNNIVDNIIYDLQGLILREKPRGPYIQNHKLMIGQ